MNRSENTIFTNMCMVYDDNGNVLVHDRIDDSWSGITFPGGHVEKNEPFTDAVIREIFEETGLTISNVELCDIKNWIRDDGGRYVVLLYKTNKYEGELHSSDEGKVWWAPLSDLPGMNLANSMKNMLKIFCDDSLTEQFFCKENRKLIELLK